MAALNYSNFEIGRASTCRRRLINQQSARSLYGFVRCDRLTGKQITRSTVGRGVREIRILDAAGAFRVLYVAKFDDAVYVLHCFQKKTQKTSKADLNLAAQRYRDLLKELDQ